MNLYHQLMKSFEFFTCLNNITSQYGLSENEKDKSRHSLSYKTWNLIFMLYFLFLFCHRLSTFFSVYLFLADFIEAAILQPLYTENLKF